MSIFFTYLSDNNADGMGKITDPLIETVMLDCFHLTAIAKIPFLLLLQGAVRRGNPEIVLYNSILYVTINFHTNTLNMFDQLRIVQLTHCLDIKKIRQR